MSGVISSLGVSTERISASSASNVAGVTDVSFISTSIMIGTWPGFASDHVFTACRHSTKVRHVEFVSMSAWWMTLNPGLSMIAGSGGGRCSVCNRASACANLPPCRVGPHVELESGERRAGTAARAAGASSRGWRRSRRWPAGCAAPRAPAGTAARGSCCATRAPGSGSGATCESSGYAGAAGFVGADVDDVGWRRVRRAAAARARELRSVRR